MKNVKPEGMGSTLEALIRAEEEASLARFRAGDFEAEVRKRVEAADGSKTESRPRGLRRPAWALAGAAAGVLIVAAGLLLLRSPDGPSAMVRSIEQSLTGAPGIEALAADRSVGRDASESAPGESDAVHLAAALASGRTGGTGSTESRRTAPRPDARPLSLEEIYKIVMVDKSIERALSLITS